MKSLIIGKGQIGSALYEIFSKVHETYIRDIELFDLKGVEVLHIAYPYCGHFVENTRSYIKQYKPRLTMIHSTVAIGTTEECGSHVVHSPERGRFPHLAKEMVQYPKFIGGFDFQDLELAASYIEKCNWQVQLIDDPSTTEALKLISNAHMGLEIAWRQEVKRFGIDYEAYSLWEDSYYQGYINTHQPQLIRSRMNPGPIGGHCIVPSVQILSQTNPSRLLDFIQESNERAKREKEIIQFDSNGSAKVSTVR